ncbi:MAG: phasin family protein [Rhodoblastus sp.]|nr:phasin family protein [Rhodoblastus sp.]
MAKKLKALAKHDDNLAATIRESANQIWLAGLGAFAKAQAEGQKVFDALVAEGQRIQEETKTAADERISEIKHRGVGAWDKLEKVFEDRVARALHSLNVPTRKDIDTLSKRVAELTDATNKLMDEKPVRKTAHAK